MTVTIPSYQRAGSVTTLDFLGDAFTKEEIIIGTQDKEDYEKYQECYGNRATVIYKDGTCCSDNRNNLLEYLEKRGIKETLQLDDDIRYARTMYRQKIAGKQFRELIESCFELCRKNDVVLFGSYATDNPLMMTKTARPNIIVGMCTGILDTSIRYEPKFLIKHDYELSLRMMSQGRRVVRFNSFSVTACHRSSGGCSEAWKRKDYIVEAQWLADAYPDLVKLHPTKKGEIKYIGR